jgi:hypothetical protein
MRRHASGESPPAAVGRASETAGGAGGQRGWWGRDEDEGEGKNGYLYEFRMISRRKVKVSRDKSKTRRGRVQCLVGGSSATSEWLVGKKVGSVGRWEDGCWECLGAGI